MKRLFVLLLSCMLVLSLLSACSQQADDETEEESTTEDASSEDETEDTAADVIDHGLMSANGEVPILEEVLEFDVTIYADDDITDYETHSFCVWLEETTNVHVNYTDIASDVLSEKIALIMASGDLPDAFEKCAFSTTDLVKYGEQGFFVDLAPYFEEFGYYSNAAYEDYYEASNVSVIKANTTPDGAIYVLSQISDCYHFNHAGRAWINQLWLDELGLETPETIDELHDVLEAFVTQDPNGNGEADELGMVGTGYTNSAWNAYVADWLLESYIYDDYDMLTAIVDDQVTYMATTDAYREGLTLIRDWVNEGLIDSEFLSLTADEYTALGMQDDGVIGVAVAALWWSAVGLEEIEDSNGVYRDHNYVALSNVEGPDGVRNTLSPVGGAGDGLVISGTCEYPEVMFRWGDYKMSEECSIYAYAGITEDPDEDGLGINGEPALYKIVDAEADFELSTTINATSEIRLGEQIDWEDFETTYYSNYEVRLYYDTRDYYVPYDASASAVPDMSMTEEDATRAAELETPIQTYQREWLGYFTLGQEDIDDDAVWESYVAGFDGYDLDEYIELLNTYYQAVYVDAE